MVTAGSFGEILTKKFQMKFGTAECKGNGLAIIFASHRATTSQMKIGTAEFKEHRRVIIFTFFSLFSVSLSVCFVSLNAAFEGSSSTGLCNRYSQENGLVIIFAAHHATP